MVCMYTRAELDRSVSRAVPCVSVFHFKVRLNGPYPQEHGLHVYKGRIGQVSFKGGSMCFNVSFQG